ncbi:MAG TPA: cobalamin-dependent protein [Candidatus Binataceae bacterium]|nr:cobalamin-dependent protein [Candidatus Binataceae bacterium]
MTKSQSVEAPTTSKSHSPVKVTIIRPPALVSKGSIQWQIGPPLGAAYLAASLRAAGHQVSVVDALGEAPFQQMPCFDDRMIVIGLSIEQTVSRIPENTAIIGISCMFSQDWPYVKRLAEALRQQFPKALLIAGGEHITATAAYTLEACPEFDLTVLGEGEEAIVEIANCVANNGDLSQLKGIAIRRDGKPLLTPERARLKNIDAIPRPAWDLVPIDAYLDNGLAFGVNRGRTMPILATRGCPYQCTFCSSPAMWTTRWQAREPEAVLDEIQDYIDRYRAANIDFYDLTATMKKDWVLKLCNLIEQRGMKFTFQIPQGTRSEVLDAEVCRALRRAGCANLTYAPESGAATTLKRIKKRADLAKMKVSIRSAVKEGMIVKTNIVMGFPDETRGEAWQTVVFSTKMALLGVHDLSVGLFSPYPGSELFDELCKCGKIPKLDEEYFLSLATNYTDLTVATAWCDKMTNRQVAALRLAALVGFYGMQYATRPWRLLRTLYNLAANRQESRMDKTLHDFFMRRRVDASMISAPQTPSGAVAGRQA